MYACGTKGVSVAQVATLHGTDAELSSSPSLCDGRQYRDNAAPTSNGTKDYTQLVTTQTSKQKSKTHRNDHHYHANSSTTQDQGQHNSIYRLVFEFFLMSVIIVN